MVRSHIEAHLEEKNKYTNRGRVWVGVGGGEGGGIHKTKFTRGGGRGGRKGGDVIRRRGVVAAY